MAEREVDTAVAGTMVVAAAPVPALSPVDGVLARVRTALPADV